MSSMRRGLSPVIVAIVGFVAGRGSGHHSTPADLTISDLQITSNASKHVLALQVTFVDLDGDLFGGTCDLATNLGSLSIPSNQVAPGHSPTDTTGPLTCWIQFKPGFTGTPLNGTVSATDPKGHTSNTLTFNTTIPERVRGSIPEGSTTASVSGDSARLGC